MDKDTVKGKANQGAGKIRERMGGAMDDEQMEQEGQEQQLKGHGQEMLGDAKNATKKAKERLS